MSLAEAEATYRVIDNTEIDVLHHGVDTDLDPRRELETTSFEQSISSWRTLSENQARSLHKAERLFQINKLWSAPF